MVPRYGDHNRGLEAVDFLPIALDDFISLDTKAQRAKDTFPVETLANQMGWMIESLVILEGRCQAFKRSSVWICLVKK